MIYLDNAATTPLHPKAREAMIPYLSETFANPSSVYSSARAVRKAVDEVRQVTATAINATAQEIYFTSGGTEAGNWAALGALEGCGNGGHIITSSVEHPCIYNLCKRLEKLGHAVTFLPVNAQGMVNPQDVENAIRPETCLVSVMFANNEVGTIQPLREISKITKAHKILFHTDAVQAVGNMPVDVDALGIDLLSLSAHKFHGPKGIGALYIRKGTRLGSMLHGGAQERSRRPGTENVMGIAGMGAALTAALETMDSEHRRLTAIRDKLIDRLLKIPHTRLNGATGDSRLARNVNVSFEYIEGESLLLHLDMHNCCASTGSACSSGALDPSHVLMAMGLAHEHANGAIRFTLGRENTAEDVDTLLEILIPTVQKLREMSPLYDDYKRNKKE